MSNPEILVDTNVWVEVLTDGARTPAIRTSMKGHRLVVSPIALAELSSLAVRRGTTRHPVEQVLHAARVENLSIEDAVAGGQLHGDMRRRRKSKFGLADALQLATARRIGAPLLSLDYDFMDMDGTRVVVS